MSHYFIPLTLIPKTHPNSCNTTLWRMLAFVGSVQFSHSVVEYTVTPWTAAYQASPSITNSQSLLRLMAIKSEMSSNHLILRHSLFLLPSIFPSSRVFSNESFCHMRWPKYWSFSISPSNEYSGLISFRMDWLDLLAVQGTFKSLLQHHSSKASILRHPVGERRNGLLCTPGAKSHRSWAQKVAQISPSHPTF